jgi:hypothetical protein
MGKDRKWTCDKIIKKFHSVTELEIEQRLAELWDILVQRDGQFHRSQSLLVPVKSSRALLNSKRSTR